MPPSQLKRLKASLHDKGILGPQKSKKQKKNQNRNGGDDLRAKRHAALAEIREDFNPFDVKALARPKKFEATTLNRSKSKDTKGVVGRPGVTKSFGEESRRATLLPELNRRHKVGGINDRRFGENDPTMTPEERMMERFVREKTRKKGASMFDLEEAEDEDEGGLTHGGKALRFDDDDVQDDFDAGSLQGSSDDDEEISAIRKRRRSMVEEDGAEEADETAQPERKKSKAEVMKEVIAKSKLHKYERQQAKEDDDDEREKLDEDFSDVLAMIKGHKAPSKPKSGAAEDLSMNPDRQALIAQATKEGKQFDEQVRALARDKRAQPTNRTKTEEEEAIEKALRLKDLEEKRLRRMRGEEESEDEAEEDKKNTTEPDSDVDEDEDEEPMDDAEAFGITRKQISKRPQGVEDEDDFLLDEDLVASGSDLESDQVESDEGSEAEEDPPEGDDEDDEFIRGLLPNGHGKSDTSDLDIGGRGASDEGSKLAFTYECPTSHQELLDIFKGVAIQDVPTVVQRIRALYHPQLKAENVAKLASFSEALVEHVSYLANQNPAPPLTVLETLIRHLHSLSRQYAEQIGQAFRSQLSRMQHDGFPKPGDLIVLTAIGTIYPTSDHFHQVVTPAITIMVKWLDLTNPKTTKDLDSGAYICTLALQYQKFSKRYIPELINFSIKALRSPALSDSHIKTYSEILVSSADLWSSTEAFIEIFSPDVISTLQRHKQKGAVQRLQIHINAARLARRPLTLHNHRPIPIKSQLPKFEETFNPDKHYDPNRERAEASKLKAEYKKERKGAMRELRKDANFIAREKLREKKEADKAYEEKYRRLVASIQNEEGAEANSYERVKRARKRNN